MSKLDIFQNVIYTMTRKWVIETSTAVKRAVVKLPVKVLLQFRFLYEELGCRGPSLSDWPNYGKLRNIKGDKRHCHLQKGRPTYVCCWEVKDKVKMIIEVYYVGTHEKAPY